MTREGVLRGSVVEEGAGLSAADLCHACGVTLQQVEVWVVEGVVEPAGASPTEWRFAGASLARVRLAARLARDLEVNEAGVALALELLERIDILEARLRRPT